jgi:hypothetical protein
VRVAHTQSNRRRRDGHRDKEAHEFCPALRCLYAMVTRFACFAVSTVDKRLPAVSCVDTRPGNTCGKRDPGRQQSIQSGMRKTR